MPETRKELFERYLQRYLGHIKMKERDNVDEKVTFKYERKGGELMGFGVGDK